MSAPGRTSNPHLPSWRTHARKSSVVCDVAHDLSVPNATRFLCPAPNRTCFWPNVGADLVGQVSRPAPGVHARQAGPGGPEQTWTSATQNQPLTDAAENLAALGFRRRNFSSPVTFPSPGGREFLQRLSESSGDDPPAIRAEACTTSVPGSARLQPRLRSRGRNQAYLEV